MLECRYEQQAKARSTRGNETPSETPSFGQRRPNRQWNRHPRGRYPGRPYKACEPQLIFAAAFLRRSALHLRRLRCAGSLDCQAAAMVLRGCKRPDPGTGYSLPCVSKGTPRNAGAKSSRATEITMTPAPKRRWSRHERQIAKLLAWEGAMIGLSIAAIFVGIVKWWPLTVVSLALMTVSLAQARSIVQCVSVRRKWARELFTHRSARRPTHY